MARKKEKQGDKMRRKIYAFLVRYVTTNGFAPTVREIGAAVGLKSTSTVYSHLWKLEREGKIVMKGNSPRAIRLVGFEFRKVGD